MSHPKTGSGPAIHLWLLLVIFYTGGVGLVFSSLWFGLSGLNQRLRSLCEAAHTAYQEGGAERLAVVAQSLERGMAMRVRLIDSQARDVSTGADASSLLSAARPPGPIPLFPQKRPQLIKTGTGHACVLEPVFERPPLPLPPAIWIVPFLSLLCAVIGWQITRRTQRIEAAVTRFGAGQLGVRISPDAGDPIGRVSRAFNQMADRIQSLIDVNRRLCIDISHELRSPLARLRLAVDLARSGDRLALDRIALECTRLDDLVGDLLEVARAEADPAVVHKEIFDAAWFLGEVADEGTIEAVERGCTIETHMSPAIQVQADPELLRRAVDNLMRNAIQHAPRGTRVEMGAFYSDDFTVIAIRDHGPGVPDSALEDIFRPFYRIEGDRDRSTGGTGLGLAIVSRIVSLHGGAVKAENAHPGLRLSLRLPRRQ
jgi:two-component system sensor histidine kinase CpxA